MTTNSWPYADLWSQEYPTGFCGLWLATHFGMTNIIDDMLSSGVQVDHEDGWGWTPLFVATENGDIA
jgi:hypothetical protein